MKTINPACPTPCGYDEATRGNGIGTREIMETDDSLLR
jgi:hypothetical protein